VSECKNDKIKKKVGLSVRKLDHWGCALEGDMGALVPSCLSAFQSP
jgi:hypothetical protein